MFSPTRVRSLASELSLSLIGISIERGADALIISSSSNESGDTNCAYGLGLTSGGDWIGGGTRRSLILN